MQILLIFSFNYGKTQYYQFLCSKSELRMNDIIAVFAFLRYCLGYKGDMSRMVAGMDWQMIYSFASKQAILGLCFDGIERLSEEYPEELKKNPIEMDLLMTWMGAAQQIHRQNMKVNMVLSEEKMIAPMDEKRGKLLLTEILNGGNFGKHFTKYGGFTHQSMGKKYFLKIWRNMHFVRYYPTEALSEPIFRTWHFFWRMKNKK